MLAQRSQKLYRFSIGQRPIGGRGLPEQPRHSTEQQSAVK